MRFRSNVLYTSFAVVAMFIVPPFLVHRGNPPQQMNQADMSSSQTPIVSDFVGSNELAFVTNVPEMHETHAVMGKFLQQKQASQ